MIPQSLGTMAAHIAIDGSSIDRGLNQAKKKLNDFSRDVRRQGIGSIAIGIGIAAPLGVALKTFSDFDDQMRLAGAVSNSTTEELKGMTDQAKLLGRTTSWTASEVAGSMTELGRAGFGFQEMKNATPAILNLARATGTDLAASAGMASDTLRAFKLNASDTAEVADIMTATANASAQTLSDLGSAMSYAAPTAEKFGLSLATTSKAIGTLANVGIKGSSAGTGLRMVMLQLAKSSNRKKIEQGLGVDVVDKATGGMRDLTSVLVDMNKAMGARGMGKADQLALMGKIFGSRAISTAMTLSTTKFDDLNKAIDNAGGTAERTAKKMDEGIGGSMRIMKSAIEGVAISVGESLAPVISKLAKRFTAMLGPVTVFIENNKWIVTTVAAVAAGFIAVGMGLLVFSGIVTTLAKTIGMVGTAIKGVSAAMSFLAANPIVLIIAAVVGLIALIIHFAGTGDTFMEKVKNIASAIYKFFLPAISAIRDVLGRVWNFMKPILAKMKQVAIVVWDAISEAATMLWTKISGIFMWGVGKIRDLWEGFWNSVGPTVQPVLDYLKPIIIGVLDKIEFAFKNWKLVIQLIMVKWAYFVISSFWKVIHQIKNIPVYLKWMADNWRDIFQTLWNGLKAFTKNAAENLWNFGKAIKDLVSGKGWNFEWTDLTKGFESTIKEWPNIVKREIGPVEQALKDKVGELEGDLAKAWQEHITKDVAKQVDKAVEGAKKEVKTAEKAADKRDKAGDFGDAGGGKSDQTRRLAGAAEAGTASAYSAIVKAQNPVEKKIEKNTSETNAHLKDILKAFLKKGVEGAEDVIDLGLVTT